jgi:prepilin-type N-terminal cleavage/methylation domain-containing protein
MFFNFFLKKNKKRKEEGFTLIEMVVAIGIFSVVVWGAIDIMLIVSSAQAKASELRGIQDNIRFALEYMTKEIRTGKNIQAITCSNPQFCSELRLTNDRGQAIRYCVHNNIIIRSKIDTCDSTVDQTQNIHLTSGEVKVNSIFFYVRGNQSGPADGQPITTILVNISSFSTKTKLQTSFNLQTSVTQRLRDLL